MGRGVYCFFTGHFAQLIKYNVLAVPFSLLIIIAVGWLAKDIYNGENTFAEKILYKRIKNKYLFIIIAVIIINWIWNIYKGV
jgi:hypothetical protein